MMDFPKPMQLRDLLDRLEPFASRDATRGSLGGVCLKPSLAGENRLVEAITTDGHRMARTIEDAPGLADVLPSSGVVVPRYEIEKIRKYLHRKGHCPAGTILPGNPARPGCGFAIEVPGRFREGPMMRVPGMNCDRLDVDCESAVNFPSFHSVFPNELGREWTIEKPAEVSEAARELAGVRESLEVYFSPGDRRLTLKAKSEIPGGEINGVAFFEAHPLDTEKMQYSSFRINGRYLADALDFVRGLVVHPRDGDTWPIVFRSAEESGLRDCMLVMPCRE